MTLLNCVLEFTRAFFTGLGVFFLGLGVFFTGLGENAG
jgi:hypothetical protein